MTSQLSDRVYTVNEVAALLKVSTRSVRRWITEGYLPVIHLGRAIRIERAEFEAFIGRMRGQS